MDQDFGHDIAGPSAQGFTGCNQDVGRAAFSSGDSNGEV